MSFDLGNFDFGENAGSTVEGPAGTDVVFTVYVEGPNRKGRSSYLMNLTGLIKRHGLEPKKAALGVFGSFAALVFDHTDLAAKSLPVKKYKNAGANTCRWEINGKDVVSRAMDTMRPDWANHATPGGTIKLFCRAEKQTNKAYILKPIQFVASKLNKEQVKENL